MSFEYPIPIERLSIVFELRFDGDPMPCERPRVIRGHTHTPRKTSEYEDILGAAIRSKIAGRQDDGLVLYGIQMLFFRSNKRRVDLDNLMKTVMDSATKSGLWKDDSQVAEVAAKLYKSQENPRVEILVYTLN